MESVEIVEAIMLVVGMILALVGSIMILINAFKDNLLWGFGGIIVPFVLPIYTFMHWDKNKHWFGIWFSGFLFYLGAIIFFAEEVVFHLHPFSG